MAIVRRFCWWPVPDPFEEPAVVEPVHLLELSLNFVACAPTFTDLHVISTEMADRLVEVLGAARGIEARTTIGVQSLAGNHCYESWIEVEIR